MKKRPIWIWGLFLVFTIPGAHVLAAPVPDTGQTTCYDEDGNVISCPSPGQDYHGQDANYTINPPSYTKLDGNGNALPASATSWVMVRDNVTDLIWEVKQDKDGVMNYNNPHDADNTYTWYDPNPVTNGGYAGLAGDGTDTDDFIDMLNNMRFGGNSDWHLPGYKQFFSICNYGRYEPSIQTEYFPNTPIWAWYWSSTTFYDTFPTYNTGAWFFSFFAGAYDTHPKSYLYHVRAVRGENFANQLKDNRNGTISDISTGLMWQQDTARDGQGNYAPMNWRQALAYCESLDLGGYTDWRLPTVNELGYLVDLNRFDPSIDITRFPNTVSGYYWSSTTYAYYPSNGWHLSFSDGRAYYSKKKDNLYLRAVRGGQTYPFYYAAPSGDCKGKFPCFMTIQSAVEAAQNDGIIEVKEGTYSENIILNTVKRVILQGGWDANFAIQNGTTILQKAPKAPVGSLILRKLKVKP